MFLLFAIVIAALIFAAFIWQVYRAVTTSGLIRANAAGLSIATLMIMASVSLGSFPLLIIGAALCVVLAPIAIWADPRWSKLLPLVHLGLGLYIIINLPAQFA
ncbi:hypothetical protein [Litoreibacter janthinus]|uniref:DoxX-like family protein n=1 Tax=Litoreibacter janthinus TaxID=670154 RepID=A0A1I6GYS3_9RHOB|nr:hypothetical protein [Litoreibacter janthinus]SFR47365.1 hypothetical protein SAMN04488002_2177 [Litoreibacter janthinus]